MESVLDLTGREDDPDNKHPAFEIRSLLMRFFVSHEDVLRTLERAGTTRETVEKYKIFPM